MKIITQIFLFGDTQNENLRNMEQLRRVIEYIPDKKTDSGAESQQPGLKGMTMKILI